MLLGRAIRVKTVRAIITFAMKIAFVLGIHQDFAIAGNQESAIRVKSVFGAVGMEFETVSKDTNGETVYRTSIFRNTSSCQLVHGAFITDSSQKLTPLTHEKLVHVNKSAQIHMARKKSSRREYAIISLEKPVSGNYTYFQSSNPEKFFQTARAPILCSMTEFEPSKIAASPIDLIFDPKNSWEPLPQVGKNAYCIEIGKQDLELSKGRVARLRTLLLFSFLTEVSGIPSKVWISGEWTVDGVVRILPYASSTDVWTFDDFRRHESGIDYPFSQVEEHTIADIGLPQLLDESTGKLETLMNGTFSPKLTPSVYRKITVKNWATIPANAALFLEAEDGVAVRNADSNDLAVKGKSIEESNRILGIVEPGKTPPPKRPFGRYFVFGAAFCLVIITIWIIRRRR